MKDAPMNTAGGKKQILIHGLAFILTGLLWGLMIPHTPFPRLAMSAHIQFESAGILLLLAALLLQTLPNRVGIKSLRVILLSAWLTWAMALSEVANSWWGTKQMLAIVAHQAGATGGTPWQEFVETAAHIAAGLALIAAWTVMLVGFIRNAPATSAD
jgi:(hydroxyamino)benzene mutase